jgi:hypothetical protein
MAEIMKRGYSGYFKIENWTESLAYTLSNCFNALLTPLIGPDAT